MPNHVTNIITTDAEHWPKIKSLFVNEEGDADLGILIPKPELFPIESIPCAAEDEAYRMLGKTKGEYGLPIMPRRGEPSEETLATAARFAEAYKKTGYLHGMAWARGEWGTKWNAYSSRIEQGVIRFDTAWSHPEPVVKALAEQAPEAEWLWEYADEDIGSNCGYHHWNGKTQTLTSTHYEYSLVSTKFALRVKDYEDDRDVVIYFGFDEEEDN